jgi:hypothetical protein
MKTRRELPPILGRVLHTLSGFGLDPRLQLLRRVVLGTIVVIIVANLAPKPVKRTGPCAVAAPASAIEVAPKASLTQTRTAAVSYLATHDGITRIAICRAAAGVPIAYVTPDPHAHRIAAPRNSIENLISHPELVRALLNEQAKAYAKTAKPGTRMTLRPTPTPKETTHGR